MTNPSLKIAVSDQVSDIPEIPYEQLEKLWEREYSLFTLSSYRIAVEMYATQIDRSQSLSFFLLLNHDNKTSGYRSFEEQNQMDKNVSEHLIADPKFHDALLSSYDSEGQAVEKMFQTIKTEATFSADFVEEFNTHYGKLSGYVLPIQRCVDYLKDFEEHQALFNELVDLRKKYEYILGGGDFDKHLRLMNEKIVKDRKLTVDPLLLRHLVVDEYVTFLKGGELPTNLAKRAELSVLAMSMSGLIVLYGNAAKKVFSTVQKIEEKNALQTIGKGMPAYGDQVIGTVQVIKDFIDLKQFVAGRILVVPSTLPKYEQYYKKAKAIITDEGGVLSHAAIFCREFKIPSIIGTKNSTKVLKDGMSIKLDCKTGVVDIQSN